MEQLIVTKTVYKVSDLLSWQRTGSLGLSPSFQRRPVWKPGAKSLFMDTIVRGLPVPAILLRHKRISLKKLEPIREVVDGQQRLRTIISYIQPRLLQDYKPSRDDFVVLRAHNDELAGKKFTALPEEIRRRILAYEFSVHICGAEDDSSDFQAGYHQVPASLEPSREGRKGWRGN